MIELILPDIHERVDVLEDMVSKHGKSVERITILGDLFDSWDGLTEATIMMARWVAKNAHNPFFRLCWGNHDLHYAYPRLRYIRCGGYSEEKQEIINKYVDHNHWNQFRLFHWSENFLCSHAGLHPSFAHPVHGFDPKWLDGEEERVLHYMKSGQIHPWLAPGRERRKDVGGITWLDWSLFEPIPGLNQIVGHSPTDDVGVRIKTDTSSFNICCDTNSAYAIMLIDGVPEIIRAN